MEATLQSIFAHEFERYAREKPQPLKHHKAANAIIQCRTPAMGGHVQRCPDGHEHHVQYHSCRHRSCPQCHGLSKARWVEAQQAKLLGCDHYHVIFTMPHQFLGLWQYNRQWFTQAFFQVCRDTLITLLQDPKHLGATPGILMALHTWGRNLSLHPHLHCLVTGGGLDAQGQWQNVQHHYLLPIKVVSALYRGKLLAELWGKLNANELVLPPSMSRADIQRHLRKLAQKPWNVCIRERYPHGDGVMKYLARYVKGGAIDNGRLLEADSNHVRFSYKDHRDKQLKQSTMTTGHFIERVLWHVPEPGQHSVRHYGLYSHQGLAKRNACRQQLGQKPEQPVGEPIQWAEYLSKIGIKEAGKCSKCAKPLLRYLTLSPIRRIDKNSIIESRRCQYRAYFQQPLEPDTAKGLHQDTGPPTTRQSTIFFCGGAG